MKVSFPFGEKKVQVELPDNLNLDFIQFKRSFFVNDFTDFFIKKIKNPIKERSLFEIAKERKSACILVSDLTRPSGANIFLPILVNLLNTCGIKDDNISIIISSGLHRDLTSQEKKELVGSEVFKRIKIINHHADDKKEMVFLGKTKYGTELWVNRDYTNAELKIVTGSINHHPMAGFSGGAKSILPGIAATKSIHQNHKLFFDSDGRNKNCLPGVLKNNPLHEDIMEGGQIAGIDFLINTICDSEGRIVDLVAGNWKYAWLEGCKKVKQLFNIKIEKLYDVVIASAGGYPKDINLYQTIKPLTSSSLPLRQGGSLFFIAECREGVGIDYDEWINLDFLQIKDKLKKDFSLAGLFFFMIKEIIREKKVYIFSSLLDEISTKTGLIPLQSLSEICSYLPGNDKTKILVIKDGSKFFPEFEDI